MKNNNNNDNKIIMYNSDVICYIIYIVHQLNHLFPFGH